MTVGPSTRMKNKSNEEMEVSYFVRFSIVRPLLHYSIASQFKSSVTDAGLYLIQKELENLLSELDLDPKKIAPILERLGVDSIKVCNQYSIAFDCFWTTVLYLILIVSGAEIRF